MHVKMYFRIGKFKNVCKLCLFVDGNILKGPNRAVQMLIFLSTFTKKPYLCGRVSLVAPRGGLEGATAHPLEASSPPSEEILGSCQSKFGKMTYETRPYIAGGGPRGQLPPRNFQS